MVIKSDEIFAIVEDTVSATLASGTDYTAGMVLTLQTTGKYTNGIIINPEDTPTGTELPFSEQIVGVLTDDVDATDGDKVGVIITGGKGGNLNKITFPATQTYAQVAGTLQAKNLQMKGWNK